MIKINQIYKKYKIYRSKKALLSALVFGGKENVHYDSVSVLNGLNLEIPSGEVHGIIGMNGAGKSTLLKILTGVIDPSNGDIEIKGRIASLLELGTGFHGELTGRENIYVNAGIMGFSRQEIARKIFEIEEFAELGDYFDRKVKTYSSGMYVRLAFSFAVSVEPDVLIIDEALSVGDAYFQQKCLDKIQSFKKRKVTILFVSHDLGAVKLLCDKVSLLAKGKLIHSGEPIRAIEIYNALLADQKNKDVPLSQKADVYSQMNDGVQSGNKAVTITRIEILGNNGQPTKAFVAGDMVEFQIDAKVQMPISSLTCGILIRDRLGYDVFGCNTFGLGRELQDLNENELFTFSFKFPLQLGAGEYTLTVALHSSKTHTEANYDWRDRTLFFQVLHHHHFESIGTAMLYPSLSIIKKEN